jgi:hypothetical protein
MGVEPVANPKTQLGLRRINSAIRRAASLPTASASGKMTTSILLNPLALTFLNATLILAQVER